MSVLEQCQPVREARPHAEIEREERPARRRRAITGPVGLALLLAGGGLLVRVAVLTVQRSSEAHQPWLFTAAACVLAGVALLLVTLPKIVPAERRGTEPDVARQRG